MYRFSFMFHLSCPGHVFCPVRSRGRAGHHRLSPKVTFSRRRSLWTRSECWAKPRPSLGAVLTCFGHVWIYIYIIIFGICVFQLPVYVGI